MSDTINGFENDNLTQRANGVGGIAFGLDDCGATQPINWRKVYLNLALHNMRYAIAHRDTMWLVHMAIPTFVKFIQAR